MPLIFIEGLPGSGKTTFAKRISEHLQKNGHRVLMFQEGDLHPIDLAWCSYMDKSIFSVLLEKYEHLKDQILKFTKYLDNIAITAYTKVHIEKEDVSFLRDFEAHEIYRQDSLEKFLAVHQDLYRQFVLDSEPDTYYIFECILLQNHINELILKYNYRTEAIRRYFLDLTKDIKTLQAEVIYIKQNDVDAVLTRIIEERRSPNKAIYKDWIDLVVDYWGSQPYAKLLGYQGVKGAYKYFKDRQSIELEILTDFPLSASVVSLDNDYDEAFDQILDVIETKRQF